jgi:hypothetical protein
MKDGTITLNCRQKDNQWSCIIHLLFGRIFKATPSAGKVMTTGFWDAEGVIVIVIKPFVQAIIFYLYSQPLNILYTYFSMVSTPQNIAEIHLQHNNA